MPPIDIVIPEKLLFIFSNLSFISFSFFVSFLLSRVFSLFILFFVFLISFLSIAYGDIFLKYAIKNYYEYFMMDSKIYANAPKNGNGKIDSLDIKDIYSHSLRYQTILNENERNKIQSLHGQYIDRFIDISTHTKKTNRYIYGSQRVYLNSNQEKNFDTARFQITIKEKNTYFRNIYGESEFRFIDKSNNLVIATAFNIYFKTSTNKFRNRYLYWNSEREEDFNQAIISNFDNIYKKVFINKR